MRDFAKTGTQNAGPILTEGLPSPNRSECERASRTASRPRILFLADSFAPHAGGSREYYFNLYRRLAELGLAKVTVLTKKVPGWQSFDKEHSDRLLRIIRSFRPLKSWKYQELPKGLVPFFQALWHILRSSPQIIHAGDLYPPGAIAWLIHRLVGIPYVIYAHGEEITQTDHYRYQPRVRDRLYREAAAVIANSEFTRKQLLRLGVRDDRIAKITPGVDAERFRPAPPDAELVRQYQLEGKTVILTVGRLVPRKGHAAALQAFASLCGEFPTSHYVIAGVGPEEHNLRYLTEELGIQDRVMFTGPVSAEKLPSLYNSCDVMLLANQNLKNGDVEGFGMVFLEANAAGKPVVGGRSGGAGEAVVEGITGLLVDSDEPAEVAHALRKLLGDPQLRHRLGEAGRRRVVTHFDWVGRARILNEVNCAVLKERLAVLRRNIVQSTPVVSPKQE